jgi:outer membrane biosynthesis protein TonB
MRKITNYYYRERSKGRAYSAGLHLLFMLLAIIGLPDFLSPPPLEEPMVISVDILPITGITNVKPSETPPAKENKPDEEKAEQKKPSPPVKTAEAVPPPPPEEAPAEKPKEKAEEIKKEEKKKEEKKKPEKKKKPKEDPLAAILKAVKETAQKEKKEKPKEEKKEEEDTSPTRSMSTQYNPGLPMSMSEKDAIMSQLARCWNVPAGAKDAQNLVVVLNAEYNSDGSYIRVELAKESMMRYTSDSFFRAAADSAIRAVKECSPLKDLPTDKFNTWRVMELRFDPQFMLN